MPISYRPILRIAARRPAAFLATASCLLLQACFSATGEDSPYTVPAGEYFEEVQLEVDPDGSILLLARVAMLYRHEKPEAPWDTNPMIRNFQSIVYRRSGGAWNATSFQNIQVNNSLFPVLVPVTGSGFQAFVADAGTVRRFALREGSWQRLANVAMPQGMYNGGYGTYRNWHRLPLVALPSDTVMLAIDRKWNSKEPGLEVEVREPGKKVIRLRPDFTPLAFHANSRFRVVVGEEASAQGEEDGGTGKSILVHYYWSPGDSVWGKNFIVDGNLSPDAYYGPYRGRTALFIGSEDGYRIFPLEADGKAESPLFQPHSDSLTTFAFLFAADSEGCIHSLNSIHESEFSIPRFVHQNTCEPGPADTLRIPAVAPGSIPSIQSVRFRIGPNGIPMAGFVINEALGNGSRIGALVASRLVFAELRGGAWVLETVQQR